MDVEVRVAERTSSNRPLTPGFIVGCVFVVVGSLLLLDKLNLIELHDLWRYWPLILIGIGVAKLLEETEKR